jgi:hypothetical protein
MKRAGYPGKAKLYYGAYFNSRELFHFYAIMIALVVFLCEEIISRLIITVGISAKYLADAAPGSRP